MISLYISSFMVSVDAFHFGPIVIFSDVFTGKGNSTMPTNEFDPLNKEIFAGESVKWSNPTEGKPYPHTVTFIGNQSSEIKSKVSNITSEIQASDLQSLITKLSEVKALKNGDNNITDQTFDGRSIIFPSVINSSDFQVTYLNASENKLYKGAQYNWTGNEQYLNSGLVWAGGVIPDGFPKINSFIVEFQEPGTYHYRCLIYPEMKGTIIVKPNPGRLGIQIQ